MDLKLFVEKSAALGYCPKCNSLASFERIKIENRFLRFLYYFFKLKKYHCNVCKWEGTVFGFKLRKEYKKILTNYLLLFIFSIIAIIVISYILIKRV